MAKEYNIENIRRLLVEGFTAKEIRRLCYDTPVFRPVYDELAENTGKGSIIDHLLEFAEQKLQFELLLDKASVHNPPRFKKYQPYHNEPQKPGSYQRVNLQADLASWKEQLAQHQRNLNILREQAAIFAAGETPLHLINQIEAELTVIKTIKSRLAK